MMMLNRSQLESAFAAIGYLAFCGTLQDHRLGICKGNFCSFRDGDVVIFRPQDAGMVIVEMPMPTERLGGSGFLATWSTTISVPASYVVELDRRDERIKGTAK